MLRRLIILISMSLILFGFMSCEKENSKTNTQGTDVTPTLEITTTENLQPNFEKSLKVLAIGNSFSEDALQWLWDIAKDYGIQEVIVGNLYIGGCDLETHWDNALNNKSNYTFFKNTRGIWRNYPNVTMEYGITNEKWDIITLQQVSGKSGLANTYENYLTNLINYVNEKKTNPFAQIAWHMTWAYQGNSTHGDFVYYNHNQLTMYNKIIETVQTVVLPKEDISFIIPSGTAIQNVRTSYLGDTLTRDGFHLSLDVGRYIAGLMYFKAITGFSIEEITFIPATANSDLLPLIKEAVNNAYQNPFEIRESSYKERP